MKTAKLISNYEKSITAIVKAFCKKQDATFEFWVDVIGGTCKIADSYFKFSDILYDMKTKQPKGLIFEWDNYVKYKADRLLGNEEGIYNFLSYENYVVQRLFNSKEELLGS